LKQAHVERGLDPAKATKKRLFLKKEALACFAQVNIKAGWYKPPE
jgi:hypothetical protein